MVDTPKVSRLTFLEIFLNSSHSHWRYYDTITTTTTIHHTSTIHPILDINLSTYRYHIALHYLWSADTIHKSWYKILYSKMMHHRAIAAWITTAAAAAILPSTPTGAFAFAPSSQYTSLSSSSNNRIHIHTNHKQNHDTNIKVNGSTSTNRL